MSEGSSGFTSHQYIGFTETGKCYSKDRGCGRAEGVGGGMMAELTVHGNLHSISKQLQGT